MKLNILLAYNPAVIQLFTKSNNNQPCGTDTKTDIFSNETEERVWNKPSHVW